MLRIVKNGEGAGLDPELKEIFEETLSILPDDNKELRGKIDDAITKGKAEGVSLLLAIIGTLPYLAYLDPELHDEICRTYTRITGCEIEEGI